MLLLQSEYSKGITRIFESLLSSTEEEMRRCVCTFKDQQETKFLPDGYPPARKKLSFILQQAGATKTRGLQHVRPNLN